MKKIARLPASFKHSIKVSHSTRSFSTNVNLQQIIAEKPSAPLYKTIPESTDASFSPHSKIFEEIVLARYAAKQFIPDKPIPPQIMSHILALSQRVPTGYNLQPWTAIVVDDPVKKRELYEVSLRQQKILDAPCTVVFAANHGQPLENLDNVLEMSKQVGTLDDEKADRIRRLSTALLDAGPLCVKQIAKYLFTYALSLFFKPMMIAPINMKAYIWKQTAFSVQALLLAASSHGIQTCPMEGFDERRIKQVVGLPSHYSVPVIVAMGYSNEHVEGRIRSPRLDPDKQFFNNTFGDPMKNIIGFNSDVDNYINEATQKLSELTSDHLHTALPVIEPQEKLTGVEPPLLPKQQEQPLLHP